VGLCYYVHRRARSRTKPTAQTPQHWCPDQINNLKQEERQEAKGSSSYNNEWNHPRNRHQQKEEVYQEGEEGKQRSESRSAMAKKQAVANMRYAVSSMFHLKKTSTGDRAMVQTYDTCSSETSSKNM